MTNILHSIVHVYNFLTSLPEELIEPIEFLPDFLKDAMIDSLNLILFLFVIFVFIEII